MAQDIKQKITLDGEKEYNAALQEAKRNLKTLKSELKAETAELGKNATAQQKAEVKTKSLQKQIKEQEKIIKTNTAALKEAKEKYGDNADVIAKWEQKLNESRATLANMKNSLDEVGEGMKKVGTSAQAGIVAANSFADSLGKIADAGGSISGAIEDAFSGIVGTIRDTISEVWQSVVDLAARSNNLVDLAGFWNTDVTTIQKYKGAVAEASGTLEDLNAIVTKINAGDAKKIAELTGVSNAAYSDQWEYAMAVMDAMSQMSKEQRNAAGFEIFGGKQATKAFDLLNDWETVLSHLDKYDVSKGGYGLTDEQLHNMSDLYDKVNGLKQSWSDLKDMALVHLTGDLALNVTGNLQAIVDAFKEYFQAEDQAGKDAAIQKIKDNIIEIFTNIKEAVDDGLKILDQLAEELKGSDDSTARALGEVLGTIVNALEWFTNPNNWESVKNGFEAIIGVWAAGKVASAVGNLASFAAHITTIKGGGRWLLGGGMSAGTGAGAAITTSEITAAITAAAGPIATAIAGLTMTVGVAVIALPALKALYDVLRGDVQPWMDYGKAEQITKETKPLNELTASDARTTLQWLLGNTGYREETEFGGNVGTTGTAIPVRRTPKGNYYYIGANEEQQAAANTWWDIYKENPIEAVSGGAFVELADAFYGSEDILEQLLALVELMEMKQKDNEFSSLEDLPAEWWTGTGSGNSLTSDDISGFRSVPGLMKAAVKEGVSGIRVSLDGRTVGSLVAPYVSEMIARDIG